MKIVEYSKGSLTEVENVFKVVESGAQGPPGETGQAGAGLPPGGDAGDSVVKSSNTDFDFIILKNNLTAAVAPTANEDSGDGYAVKSLWFDTVAGKIYQCIDASVGAADWIDLSASGGGGGGGIYALHESRVMTNKMTELFIPQSDNDILLLDNFGRSVATFLTFACSIDGGLTYPATHNTYDTWRQFHSTTLGKSFTAAAAFTYVGGGISWLDNCNGMINFSQITQAAAPTMFKHDFVGKTDATFTFEADSKGSFDTNGVVDMLKVESAQAITKGFIHHLKRVF